MGIWSPKLMVPELEKPRVTELQLRIDCNGCVQKIKKALHNVDGVYDIYIDTAQQKLTVVGRAELDKILRAIKKTKKIATICSHTDPNAPPPPPEQLADGQPPPAPEAAPPTPPPPEAPPAKPEEPPKDPPPPPPSPLESQPTEVKLSEEAKDATPPEPPKVVEEVHMVHHYPYTYVYNRQHEAPSYVNQWSPAPKYRHSWMDSYDEGYYYPCRPRGDGNKMTLFSEENPNNCMIM